MKFLLHSLLAVCSAATYVQGMTYYMGGDPCSPNPCGSNTQCNVASNRPVCSCLPGHWGNPLTYCQRGECQEELCDRSPCGVNTRCEVINMVPTCSCLPGYTGSPLSGCRHECDSDYDCGPSQSCVNYKCANPCASGACAPTAQCEVRNHRAVCSCPVGYLGDPYTSCRAECLAHSDCPTDRPSCLGNKCMNPCAGQCGINAKCEVRGATPICSCPRDMTGDPFVRCRPFDKYDLCEPNPCGENAKCQPGYDKSGKDRPVCTCLPGYVGDALTYCRRGECQSDAECNYDQVCNNYNCEKACTSQCGINAQCTARNHVATCSCPAGYQGDALSRCYPAETTSYRRGRVYYNKK
ncbi:hypothetical protein M8J77_007046 [Diaphorina citri]|nr:hypothetical protein M8J77_007046 [Diaphorina citri]